jgi:hypothetical protein
LEEEQRQSTLVKERQNRELDRQRREEHAHRMREAEEEQARRRKLKKQRELAREREQEEEQADLQENEPSFADTMQQFNNFNNMLIQQRLRMLEQTRKAPVRRGSGNSNTGYDPPCHAPPGANWAC